MTCVWAYIDFSRPVSRTFKSDLSDQNLESDESVDDAENGNDE